MTEASLGIAQLRQRGAHQLRRARPRPEGRRVARRLGQTGGEHRQQHLPLPLDGARAGVGWQRQHQERVLEVPAEQVLGSAAGAGRGVT